MALLIISNSLVIGMETDIRDYPHWNAIENAFLVAFFIELALKLIIIGPKEMFSTLNVDFNWNCFDTFIVSLGLLDVFFSLILGKSSGSAATMFRIIRLLRILRIIRIVKFLKQLYLLAFGLLDAAQAVFWVTILMTFIIYVCAIIMVKTVGRPEPSDPHYDFLSSHFGGVVPSMLTLFVLMSSPNMPIYQDEEGLLECHPFFAGFLVIFIIFGSFGMIALLTGVISESMFEKNDMKKEEERMNHEMMRRGMEEQCAMLFGSLTVDEEGAATCQDVKALIPQMAAVFDECGQFFSQYDLNKIVDYMDVDESGTVDQEEFTRGMLVLAEGVRPISVQEVYHEIGVCRVKLERMEESMGTKKTEKETAQTPQESTEKPGADKVAEREDSGATGGTEGLSSMGESPEVQEGVHDLVMKNLSAYLEEVLNSQRKAFNELASEVRGLVSLHVDAVPRGDGFAGVKAPMPGFCLIKEEGEEDARDVALHAPKPVRGYALGAVHHGAGTPSTSISSSTSVWPGSWAQSGWPVGAPPTALTSVMCRDSSRTESEVNIRRSSNAESETDKYMDPFDTFGPSAAEDMRESVSLPPSNSAAPPVGSSSGPRLASAARQSSSGPLPACESPNMVRRTRGDSHIGARYQPPPAAIETDCLSSPSTSSPPSAQAAQGFYRQSSQPNMLAGSGSPPESPPGRASAALSMPRSAAAQGQTASATLLRQGSSEFAMPSAPAGLTAAGPLPTLLQEVESETARRAVAMQRGARQCSVAPSVDAELASQMKELEGWHRDVNLLGLLGQVRDLLGGREATLGERDLAGA